MRPIDYRAQQHTYLNTYTTRKAPNNKKKTHEKLQLFDVFFIKLCQNISEPNQLNQKPFCCFVLDGVKPF